MCQSRLADHPYAVQISENSFFYLPLSITAAVHFCSKNTSHDALVHVGYLAPLRNMYIFSIWLISYPQNSLINDFYIIIQRIKQIYVYNFGRLVSTNKEGVLHFDLCS